MIERIVRSFEAGWALALRSIQQQVIEHKLGYAWSLIIPILYAVCYLVIKQSLNGSDEDALYHAFNTFTGMVLLQLWIQTLQDMTDLVRKNRGMLKGLNVGIEPFVIGVMCEGAISLVIRASIILVASIFVGHGLPTDYNLWGWALISGVTIICSAAALGLLLAPWSALYADVRKAIRALTMPMALISPIFYPAVTRADSPLYLINQINPLASPLAVINAAMAGDQSLYRATVLVWLLLSLLLLVWAGRLIHRQVPIVLERLGS